MIHHLYGCPVHIFTRIWPASVYLSETKLQSNNARTLDQPDLPIALITSFQRI